MKKINLGIVLILLTLFGLTVYIINKEKIRNKEKEIIEEVLNDYYDIYNKYSVLPEEYRDLNKIIEQSEYSNYISQMKYELSKYILEENQEEIFNNYISRFDEQVKGKYMYNKYIKTIEEIREYNFNDEYIYALLKVKIDVDKDKRISPTFNEKTGKYIGSIKSQIGIDYTLEWVVFKKVGNEYKIALHAMIDPVIFTFEDDMGEIQWQI